MSNILVTGAGGFIGGAVARQLISDGYKVITIDNFTTGFRNQLPVGIECIEGNCQDFAIIEKLGSEPLEAILHIAGQSSGEISFDDPIYDLQTNGQSTLMLLKYALRVKCKKFIFASTMSVYGEGSGQPVGEGSRTVPQSFYAIGKLASENYMRIYSQYGLSTTALRLFNVYGPGQNLQNLRQGMVSIYLSQAIKEGNILVKGSPDRFRDLVYIDDVVSAFIKALKLSNSQYQVCNIGTGIKTTVGSIVDSIQEKLPGKVSVQYKGATPGDVHGVYAKVDKAQRLLGWNAKVNFNDGLNEMIKWAMK